MTDRDPTVCAVLASEMILHLRDSGMFNLKRPTQEVEMPLIHEPKRGSKRGRSNIQFRETRAVTPDGWITAVKTD